jgi:hypothetical protein
MQSSRYILRYLTLNLAALVAKSTRPLTLLKRRQY